MSNISIVAFVTEDERQAVKLAASHIAQALGEATGRAWTCDCVFSTDMETLRNSGKSGIIVTSLLTELVNFEKPWPPTERRLRAAYADLTESGYPVFVCTILRHVSRDEESGADGSLRIFIRRLNLLAAEISRETKAYVIDIDRVLADIGARRLQTDYRLAGSAATETVGHLIAHSLINYALEALVSYEVQDAAKGILASRRPSIGECDIKQPKSTRKKTLLSVGRGRQKQTFLPENRTIPQNFSGLLIKQVLRGDVRPALAFQRLLKAVRRLGVRETASLIATGLSKQITRRK
jgi:hypothetical protein